MLIDKQTQQLVSRYNRLARELSETAQEFVKREVGFVASGYVYDTEWNGGRLRLTLVEFYVDDKDTFSIVLFPPEAESLALQIARRSYDVPIETLTDYWEQASDAAEDYDHLQAIEMALHEAGMLTVLAKEINGETRYLELLETP